MIAHLTAAMLVALAPAQQADTTFRGGSGGRLEVNQLEGVVDVTGVGSRRNAGHRRIR